MTACPICHDPAETCSEACAVDLAFAKGHITDYPEETHMPDTYEYKTRDGQTVDLFDHVYVKHGDYCRAEITDTRIDDSGALLLVECEDGPNWVYETEIWAKEPAR